MEGGEEEFNIENIELKNYLLIGRLLFIMPT